MLFTPYEEERERRADAEVGTEVEGARESCLPLPFPCLLFVHCVPEGSVLQALVLHPPTMTSERVLLWLRVTGENQEFFPR